jgi:hypothetical protein
MTRIWKIKNKSARFDVTLLTRWRAGVALRRQSFQKVGLSKKKPWQFMTRLRAQSLFNIPSFTVNRHFFKKICEAQFVSIYQVQCMWLCMHGLLLNLFCLIMYMYRSVGFYKWSVLDTLIAVKTVCKSSNLPSGAPLSNRARNDESE